MYVSVTWKITYFIILQNSPYNLLPFYCYPIPWIPMGLFVQDQIF